MANNEQDKEQDMMKGGFVTTMNMNVDDETEDEEVKRNCYGRKYCSTSSSSEEGSGVDSEDDDDTESEKSSSEESFFEKGDDCNGGRKDDYDESSTISTYPESDLSREEEGMEG